MATPDGDDSNLPNKVYDNTNCVTIHYEKDVRAGMPLFGKKKKRVVRPDFKESEDAESFERNCQVWLRDIS